MNDFLDSLYNGLCELDMSLHNTKLKDTFVDDFIHELQDYLVKSDVTYRLSKLPKDTMLYINEIENNHLQCYLNHEEYAIPKEIVYKPDLVNLINDGSFLQLQNDGLYHVIKNN
ncbi:MAG: hypothetical protein J6D03_09280 [Clostridia bacterium]|nr:hypothetical protein [Clostridia bacterium]